MTDNDIRLKHLLAMLGLACIAGDYEMTTDHV